MRSEAARAAGEAHGARFRCGLHMADALGVLIRRANFEAVDLLYVPARGNAQAMVLLSQRLDAGQHERLLVLGLAHHVLHGAVNGRAVWRRYGDWPEGWCDRRVEDIAFALAMLGLPAPRGATTTRRRQNEGLL